MVSVDLKLTVMLVLEAPQAGEVTVPMTPLPPSWSFLSEIPEPQIIVGKVGVIRIPGLFVAIPMSTRWKTLVVLIIPDTAAGERQLRVIPRMVVLAPSSQRVTVAVVSLVKMPLVVTFSKVIVDSPVAVRLPPEPLPLIPSAPAPLMWFSDATAMLGTVRSAAMTAKEARSAIFLLIETPSFYLPAEDGSPSVG